MLFHFSIQFEDINNLIFSLIGIVLRIRYGVGVGNLYWCNTKIPRTLQSFSRRTVFNSNCCHIGADIFWAKFISAVSCQLIASEKIIIWSSTFANNCWKFSYTCSSAFFERWIIVLLFLMIYTHTYTRISFFIFMASVSKGLQLVNSFCLDSRQCHKYK